MKRNTMLCLLIKKKKEIQKVLLFKTKLWLKKIEKQQEHFVVKKSICKTAVMTTCKKQCILSSSILRADILHSFLHVGTQLTSLLCFWQKRRELNVFLGADKNMANISLISLEVREYAFIYQTTVHFQMEQCGTVTCPMCKTYKILL